MKFANEAAEVMYVVAIEHGATNTEIAKKLGVDSSAISKKYSHLVNKEA